MSKRKINSQITGRDFAKILVLLLLVSLGVLLIYKLVWLDGGVGKMIFKSSPSESQATHSVPETSIKESGQFVIGISQPNFAEPWRLVANAQYKEAAAKHPEFKLVFADGRLDNNKQISDIQSFIDQRVDLIIVSPNEAKPLTEIITKAYDAGIPVILVDRGIEGDAYTQFIGADNTQIGFMAGQWIASYLGDSGGNVIELTGTEGTSAQIERHDGFIAAIQDFPNIHVIDSRSMDWIYDRSITVMETMLEKHSSIDVVYSQNDPGAEGAYKAAQAVNREKEMKFVGIDALPTSSGGIMSVIEGRISVTFVYPTGSKEAIESAYQLLVLKQDIDKTLTLDTLEITPENARTIYNQLNGLDSAGNVIISGDENELQN